MIEEKFKHLGELQEGQTVKVTFTSKTPLEIRDISVSCNCIKYGYKEKEIFVTYTAGKVPVYLWHKGRSSTTKALTVYYKDGTTDSLSFTAIIIKK